MAIESLDLAIQAFGPLTYVYHEIVHNKYVVESFRSKGAIFVESLAEVPVGSTPLFSAHGVSPAIRQAARERQLTAIHATCPLVTKVHLEAIRFAKAGYTIVLIGHEGHDEVIGTMGESPQAYCAGGDDRRGRCVKIPADDVAGLSHTVQSRCRSTMRIASSIDYVSDSRGSRALREKTSAMPHRIARSGSAAGHRSRCGVGAW